MGDSLDEPLSLIHEFFCFFLFKKFLSLFTRDNGL